MEADSYRVLSRYYDAAYGSREESRDVLFYADLAQRIGGPALEIGCGTGRVLMEVAARGIAIDGLDSSEDQLRVLQAKLEKASAETRNRVSLHHADMRTFTLTRRYRLITAPFRPVQHLYTTADQIAAFRAIRAHLVPDGRFAFDAFYPQHHMLDEPLNVEHPDLEWADPGMPGRIVRRSFLRQRHDRLNQTFSGQFIFRTFEGDTAVSEEREQLEMSYYTYPQFTLLFELSGFRILEEYGGFSREPIGICKEMVFLLGCA